MLAIAGLSGVAGLFWGIYQYRENRLQNRKETLFELIHEFDNSEKMFYAKKILDGFIYNNIPESKKEQGYFNRKNLVQILRNHQNEGVYDKGEILVRASFDGLLDFFDKLGYLYVNKLLKKSELSYFSYYINRARKYDGVVQFSKLYEFRWHSEIPILE